MKRILYFLLPLFFLSVHPAFSQSDVKETKQQKAAEKQKKKQEKKALKAEEKGKKRHLAIQTKKVRKRLKRNSKRFDHVDTFDRRPNFIQRIFHRKKPSAY